MMAVRRALPFLLMPFVVVPMLTASSNAFGSDTQPWTLAAGSVLVVIGGAPIGASEMTLIPPDDVGPASPAVQPQGLYPAATIGSWPEDPNIS